jgi:hypothetical protein
MCEKQVPGVRGILEFGFRIEHCLLPTAYCFLSGQWLQGCIDQEGIVEFCSVARLFACHRL